MYVITLCGDKVTVHALFMKPTITLFRKIKIKMGLMALVGPKKV